MFRVPFRLSPGDHLVRGIGEEALQAAEESVVVPAFHFLDKTPDLEGCLRGAYARVEREEIFDKSFFYL